MWTAFTRVVLMQDYIVADMGATFIEPPTFDLNSSYLDSNASTPLIFILSPGADPMASLVKFAEEKGTHHSFRYRKFRVVLFVCFIFLNDIV